MTALDLVKIANRMRQEVLKMVHLAQAGHVAGPMSAADLLAVLYFGGVTKFDPNNPEWEERDRVVLSAGHYAPLLYAFLAEAGFFAKDRLISFGTLRDFLGVHPEKKVGEPGLPGVEISSGPLGQGVSVAAGMALALKLKYGERPQEETPKVFCILSDGEMQEGQVWEAFQFAVRRQLDNLIYILDRNRVQIERYVSEVAQMNHIAGALEALGLEVYEADGHDIAQIEQVLSRAKRTRGGPSIVILRTVAGKGVKFMESDPKWHDRVPSDEELARAILELEG